MRWHIVCVLYVHLGPHGNQQISVQIVIGFYR